jgi:hypothetical protein
LAIRLRLQRRGSACLASFGLALVVSLCGGCSFLFVHGPPANHKQLQYFDCSTSNVAPVLDTIFGASAAVNVVGAAADSREFSNLGSQKTTIAIAAGEAALFVASAAYGYMKTSDCRAAQADMLARMPLVPAGPPRPVVDPWTGRPVAPPPP